MAIITLARERGAYGRMVAKLLAESLGAHFIDREIVDSRLEKMGIAENKRMAFDERKPKFFAALSSAVEEYTCCLKQVMFEEAQGGNCVILGRGSQALFHGIPGVVSVRLVASPDVRYERVSKQEHISFRQAQEVVSRTDRDRAGFNSYFFDSDWSGPLGYDLVLNTDRMTPQNVVAVIKALADERVKPADGAAAAECLKNLGRAQSIERDILYTKHFQVFFLKVVCEGPVVTLQGVVHSPDQIDQVKKAAKVDGVEQVVSQLEVGVHGQFNGPRI